MKEITQVENNTIFSFGLVREDVIRLQNDILYLRKTQNSIVRAINDLKSDNLELQGKIKKLGKKEKMYVSSKAGKKFHIQECPFAQRIKPSNKIIFDNKLDAMSESFTACECAA